jgi:ATP-dependent Clp protease ATP-binding subunit ClpA
LFVTYQETCAFAGVGAGEKDSPDQMPFTTPAKESLELALREALCLGHDYIGTEHLLLGLVRESESVVSGILCDCNAARPESGSTGNGLNRASSPSCAACAESVPASGSHQLAHTADLPQCRRT